MALNKEEMKKWLRRTMRDVTEDGGVKKFVLYHSVSGMGPEMIDQFPSEDADPADLADIVHQTAKQDAETRQGGAAERYTLVAIGSNDEPITQFPFLIEPIRVVGSADHVDAPTEQGFRGQMLRHNESMHKLTLGAAAANLAAAQEELQRERRRRLEAEAALDEFTAREKAARAPVDALSGLLTGLLPVLVAQFVGSPQQASAPAVAQRPAAPQMPPQPQAAQLAPMPVQSPPAPPPQRLSNEFMALCGLVGELNQNEVMELAASVSQIHQLAFFELYKGISDPKSNKELLDVASQNLILDLSEKELEQITNSLRPENAKLFFNIYLALRERKFGVPKMETSPNE